MPLPGSRTLKRYTSEAAEDSGRVELLRKERAEAWRLAQAARKKLVHVGYGKITTKADVQQAFEKTPAFLHFAGKPAEQHRVFVFTADLFQESRTTPWSTGAEWGATADVMLEWMLAQSGNCDCVFASDGRSRSCRMKIEQAFDKARHVHEAWIVYKPTKRLGRRVAYSADNKESICISMPLSRTQLSTFPRAKYNSAGEETTHETTYTGVVPVPWGALPLLLPANKEKIMGYAAVVPPSTASQKVFDTSLGLPLFWNERKDAAIWKQLLKDIQAKSIFDLTPGSGQCARAAMEAGIQYSCIARSAEHCSWLVNVLDRVALGLICKTGSPLYQQDLAQCVREHFVETLDQLNEQDNATESVMEDK